MESQQNIKQHHSQNPVDLISTIALAEFCTRRLGMD